MGSTVQITITLGGSALITKFCQKSSVQQNLSFMFELTNIELQLRHSTKGTLQNQRNENLG